MKWHNPVVILSSVCSVRFDIYSYLYHKNGNCVSCNESLEGENKVKCQGNSNSRLREEMCPVVKTVYYFLSLCSHELPPFFTGTAWCSVAHTGTHTTVLLSDPIHTERHNALILSGPKHTEINTQCAWSPLSGPTLLSYWIVQLEIVYVLADSFLLSKLPSCFIERKWTAFSNPVLFVVSALTFVPFCLCVCVWFWKWVQYELCIFKWVCVCIRAWYLTCLCVCSSSCPLCVFSRCRCIPTVWR